MKKLFLKLALLSIPFFIYLAVFITFEPYNYFGLKSEAKNSESVIARVRLFINEKPQYLLLGDSRMAHFNTAEVSAITGDNYGTMAFGGNSLNEAIDLFWLAVDELKDKDGDKSLKTVVVGISFYTLNEGYYKDRANQIKTVVHNPFAFVLNRDYNIEMLNELRLFASGIETGAKSEEGIWPDEDYFYENGTPRPYRKNLMEYADTILRVCENRDVNGIPQGYKVDKADVKALKEMAQYCKKNGIRLVLVATPCDISLYNTVIKPLGIEKKVRPIYEELATYCEVYDYEFANRIAQYDDVMYYDGFHLDPVRGLPVFQQYFFGTVLAQAEGGAQ